MDKLKLIYKSFVMMFSEVIWIYYVIVLFTSVEWNQAAFFDITWFVIAGILGYVLNLILLNIRYHMLGFVVNIVAIGFIVIQNWKNIVPEEAWSLGLAVSIGAGIIFVRSARLVKQQPTRQELLRRFEGNIIYYIIFALSFSVNNWNNVVFHILFIFGIISSLMTMILTLQGFEESEDNRNIKVIKVGQSTWFAGLASILLAVIPLITLILLLPSVNKSIYFLVVSLWEKIKWIGAKLLHFLHWIMSLFPESEINGTIPDNPPQQIKMPAEGIEERFTSLPSALIITIIAILFILAAIWVITKIVKKSNEVMKIRPQQIIIRKESLWLKLKRKLTLYLQILKTKFYMSFSYFYIHPVYWYYNKLLKWGNKNGFPKTSVETSKEYINRIIKYIPESKNIFTQEEKVYNLAELLMNLNNEYQGVYYGMNLKKINETEYKILINYLKGITIRDTIL